MHQVSEKLSCEHADRQTSRSIGEYGQDYSQVNISMVGEAVVEQECLEALKHHLAAMVVTGSAEILGEKTRVHIDEQRRENLAQVEWVSVAKKSGEARDHQLTRTINAVDTKKTIDESTPMLIAGHDHDVSGSDRYN